MIKNFKWVLIASLAFVACNNDDEVTIDSNSSDGKPLTAQGRLIFLSMLL